MKKIFFAALAALVSTGAFAQNIEWGAKAGVNLAKETKVSNVKMRVGFHAGVFGEYVISDYFGVQGELLYSQMGYKNTYGGLKQTFKSDYLVVPVLAKFYALEGLSVDLGPQFGYMLSATVKQGKSKVNLYKAVDKKFDVSAALGLTYEAYFGLDLYARYNLGLTKLGNVGKGKNNVISIGVGYRF